MNRVVMSSIELKFAQLTDGQRRTVHLIAKGRADDYLARGSNIDLGSHASRVVEIMKTLGCRGGDYAEKRTDLIRLGREFFNLGDTPSSEELEVGAESSPGAKEDLKREASPPQTGIREDHQEETPELTVTAERLLPTKEALAKRILRLSPKERERLEIVATAEKGDDRNKLGHALGLSAVSISQTMNAVYKKLHLPNFKGRKTLLRESFEEVRRQAREAREPREPVALPAEVLPPQSLEPKHHEENELPAPVPAPDSSTPPASGGFGAGVVIPIPADVSEVEVLSGEFTRDDPSAGIKEQILDRKKQGLRPSFVVLYPSLSDPSSAQGHVIFFRRDSK